ncbi:MAG: helix-turn-helix domain-containing protein, partial [Conexivisphaera sp.]
MNERLLPPREVYKRLGVHYMTVKRWIYSGRIKAVKTPTGRWLIPESEVVRILGGGA